MCVRAGVLRLARWNIVGYTESSPSNRKTHCFAHLSCVHSASKNSKGCRAGKHPSRLRVLLAWTPATVATFRVRSMENRERDSERSLTPSSREKIYVCPRGFISYLKAGVEKEALSTTRDGKNSHVFLQAGESRMGALSAASVGRFATS